MDAELPVNEDSLELIDNARALLMDREFRLVNVRKNAIEAIPNKQQQLNGGGSSSSGGYGQQPSTANLSATTPVQLTPSSSYDPFKRNDNKRRSITNSFSNMFRRPSAAGKYLFLLYLICL